MSQADIMKILGKLDENGWISTNKLAKILKINTSTIISNLTKLRKYNEIESKPMEIKGWNHNAQLKHRLTRKGRR